MGIADKGFSRTNVYMQALRAAGVEIVECFSEKQGVRKFFDLLQQHYRIRNTYDVLIVGYPSYIVVPFARVISRKPIIFDAGWSLYEGIVISRGRYRRNPLGRFYIWCIDWFAYRSADLVLLETEHQITFYTRLLDGSKQKCRRVFTGCDESIFHPDPSVRKRERFTALFRGKYTQEAGVPYVIEAARLLEQEAVDFLVLCPGVALAPDLPHNVEVVGKFLDTNALRARMLACHVSIGQLEAHERLERTIPHKAFESIAMELPYVTAQTSGVGELLIDRESCLMVNPADARDLANTILELRNDHTLRERIAKRAREVYNTRAARSVLAQEMIGHIRAAADTRG